MTDTVSSTKERRLRQSSDELWSWLQLAWLRIPPRNGGGQTSLTWDVFSERFDRCFQRASSYVKQRVSDRETLARIVTAVLIENLELFLTPCGEREEMKRLTASADRLLLLEAATSPAARISPPPREQSVGAAQADEQG